MVPPGARSPPDAGPEQGRAFDIVKELKEAGTVVDNLIATVAAVDLPSKAYVANLLSPVHSNVDRSARDLQRLSAGLLSVFDRSGLHAGQPLDRSSSCL